MSACRPIRNTNVHVYPLGLLRQQLLVCHNNLRMHKVYWVIWSCVGPSLDDEGAKWEEHLILGCFFLDLINPWGVSIQEEERHIQPYNSVAIKTRTDPGQCICQGNLLSLDILDFYILLLNPKKQIGDMWGASGSCLLKIVYSNLRSISTVAPLPHTH